MRCSEALVIDSLKVNAFHSSDSRLSVLVDQKVYEQASKNADAEAVLYGVPMSGSYSEYKELATELRSRYENSYSQEDALSVSWSGLSKNAADAYKACLASHGVMQGLSLELVDASDDQIVISLHWKKGIGGPAKIDLEWQGDLEAVADLPTEVSDAPEGLPFVIPRPKEGNYFLAVRGSYEGEHILGDYLKIAAVTKPVEVPRVPRSLESWSADIGRSELTRAVPLEARGRSVRFKLRARASSKAGGTMQALISIDGKQIYASEVIPAADNPEINRTTEEIMIPLMAKRIHIKFANTDANAEWGWAEIIC